MAWSAKDLETIFGQQTLTATAIRAKFMDVPFVADIPKRDVATTTYKYDVIEPNREIDTAFTATDGSSTGVQRQTYATKAGEMPITFKNVMMPSELLEKLRTPGTENTTDATKWVTNEITNLKQRFGDYLNSYMIAMMLRGTLTITVNSVSTAIDYELPATHQPTNLAGWSVAGTSIKADVTAWKRLIADETGYQPRDVYLNQTSMNYVFANTEIQNYIKETRQVDRLVEEGVISDLYALTWHVVDQSYISSGSPARFVLDNRLIMMPAMTDEWIELLTGKVSILEANGTQVGTGVGPQVWATINEDPPAIKVYYKYARLPILKVPRAIVYATLS